MRRGITTTLLALVLVGVIGAVASASASTGQASGQGLTHDGNTEGFNAKADLTGHFAYVAHDRTFSVKCNDYNTYHFRYTKRQVPIVHVTSTCTDQDGITIWMEAYWADRGEPGTLDSARIYFTYDPNFAQDPDNDPGAISDVGHIQTGNVQIQTQ